MKAKKRRLVAKLMKQIGMNAKLYKGHKLRAYRFLRGWRLSQLLETLPLYKVGQIVNDCDGLNHIVKKVVMRKPRVAGVVQTPRLEFEDGNWGCGCFYGPEPAKPREAIEAKLKDWYRRLATEQESWQLSDKILARHKALEEGRHIVDERGLLLQEFV